MKATIPGGQQNIINIKKQDELFFKEFNIDATTVISLFAGYILYKYYSKQQIKELTHKPVDNNMMNNLRKVTYDLCVTEYKDYKKHCNKVNNYTTFSVTTLNDNNKKHFYDYIFYRMIWGHDIDCIKCDFIINFLNNKSKLNIVSLFRNNVYKTIPPILNELTERMYQLNTNTISIQDYNMYNNMSKDEIIPKNRKDSFADSIRFMNNLKINKKRSMSFLEELTEETSDDEDLHDDDLHDDLHDDDLHEDSDDDSDEDSHEDSDEDSDDDSDNFSPIILRKNVKNTLNGNN